MIDTVDKATRSRIMSAIRGKNTKPEITLRHAIHRRGFRYRLHARNLPGTPDLVFRRYNAVCFVHGCFWHHHEGCKLATIPATRTDYWSEKFEKNVERDKRAKSLLLEEGWRVATLWECALVRDRFEVTVEKLESWLQASERELETMLTS